MRNKIISAALLLTMSLFTGCDDFLDTTATDRISDKIVWESASNITLYLNGFYPYIDRYGSFGTAQFSGNLTEGLTETLKYGSYVPGSKAGDANMYVFTPEMMNPSGNLLNTWGATYERIRRVNEFLVGLEKYSTVSQEENKIFEDRPASSGRSSISTCQAAWRGDIVYQHGPQEGQEPFVGRGDLESDCGRPRLCCVGIAGELEE